MMLHGRRAILLDLDGTLVDSCPGIIASYTAALNGLGHTPAAELDMTALIGPPIGEAMAHLLAPFGDPRIGEATALYRTHYASTGLFDCVVYPGIADALLTLSSAGLALYVATSKRTAFAPPHDRQRWPRPLFRRHLWLRTWRRLGAEAGADPPRARRTRDRRRCRRHGGRPCLRHPRRDRQRASRHRACYGATARATNWRKRAPQPLPATPAELVGLLGLEMRD